MSLHPAVAAVRLGVRRTLGDLEPGARVVVACSGGADSLALTAAVVFEAGAAGWHVIGATIDHGLQAGSAEHAARVVAQLVELGVDETVSARASVDAPGLGPEAAARQARHALLEQIAQSLRADVVLLGHTRDDQAETVLLGLARGSGGRSLAGMRRSYGVFRRPLLDVSRDDTVTACQVQGVSFWDDPHNADPAFTRTRVRRTVLPTLERELGPGVAETLARTADQLRIDMDHLDDLADTAFAELAGESAPEASGSMTRAPSLPIAGLLALPLAVRRRVLHRAAVAAGAPPADVTHERVLALDSLISDWRGQKWIDLPGHLRASRREHVLRLDRVSGEGAPPLG